MSQLSLIAGLDIGLDCWTGSLDWITGLTFELKLCVLHDLHPIRCAELGRMFNAKWLIDYRETKDMQQLWEFCA